MNEASAWRYTLAQQIAPHYSANPKVTTVGVAGSVAHGYADRSSDLDLAVFWTEPPTTKERRDIITRARGTRGPRLPSAKEKGWWSDTYEVCGITIDVRHLTVEASERILADVLERYDLSLYKQQHLATLLSALPLSDPSVLTLWQSRALVYPHNLSVAMVRAYLKLPAGRMQHLLAERNDLLLLYDSLCLIEKRILLVLMGLNHIYYPGWRWMDRLIAQMPLAPAQLAPRFQQVFGIVSIDPLASVYQLHDLVEETFRLVENHLPEIEMNLMRARFGAQRQVWEHASDGLV
jgi:hypothetical protein